MFIKSLEYDSISYVKHNLNKIKEKLHTKTFFEIFEEEFGIAWYKLSKIIKPNIKFIMDETVSKRSTDYENSIKVYSALKNLTESQASDERLWAGLAIEPEYYEYLKYRWGDTKNTLRYRVVYHAGGKRGFMYHGLARLWWLAHITYDESRSNPFELTKFTFKYPHILEKMIYRNFSNSKDIRIGIIEGIQKYVDIGGEYKIKKIDELYKHISTLGSVSLIDNYSQHEIKETTVNILQKYDQNEE